METTLIQELSPFVQYGAVGICIALIGLLFFVIKSVFGIIQRNSEIQQKLVSIVEQDAQKTSENTQVLRELSRQLEICNAIKK